MFKTFSHALEYAVLRALEIFITILPRAAALFFGALAGNTLYCAGVYRKIVDRNFDHVGLFQGKERRRIVKRLYRNMGRYAADMLRNGTAPPYTVRGKDGLDMILGRGKGSIAVLAHFGNWELLATYFGTVYPDLNVLARPMHNPLVEKWLLAKRKKARVTQIYASGALRKILTVLRRNGIVAMLIDQYSAEQGQPAPFLGKTANTVRTAAGLAHRTGCGVVLPYALLQKDGSYEVIIEPSPDIPAAQKDASERAPEGGEEAAVAALLAAHNNVISRWIFACPDHYFGWFHRRFKDVIRY